MKDKVKLKYKVSREEEEHELDRMLKWTMNDDEFCVELKAELEKNKTLANADTHWPTALVRSRFLRKYKFKYGMVTTEI